MNPHKRSSRFGTLRPYLGQHQREAQGSLPKPTTSGSKAKRRFVKADFRYLADQDVYICPAGEQLNYYYTNEEKGLTLRRYWTNACRTCALKDRCTTGVQRRITRWQHEPCCGSRAKAAGRDPTSHAPAPRDGRASLWHDQGADRGNALSDENPATRRDLDGLARARLQPHPHHEHLRYRAADQSDRGIGAAVRVCQNGLQNALSGCAMATVESI